MNGLSAKEDPSEQAKPMERITEALDMALRFTQGQTWPGSRIPHVAHAMEVACRVAALGGEEDTTPRDPKMRFHYLPLTMALKTQESLDPEASF